ncbi:4-hydroxyproline epimerase [Acrasis kona]|uniref:trans-L-3-hydroxyproline dehydratase n=1 Tax=Acrasis kona TaxID=1008807 RepID=A0AAW2ZLL8_9EUKA
MSERLADMQNQYDKYRTATILEPRGNDVIVGALLTEPTSKDSCAGVIFFNNAGYLGMCGHGLIGLVVTLAHLGRINPGAHNIDTPVGTVTATLHDDYTVSVRNVPCYRYRRNISLHVDGYGQVTGDIAWGGNWFFLIKEHNLILNKNNVEVLTDYTWRVRKALEKNQITGSFGSLIDHVELFTDDDVANSRNFVLCPGRAYDRSPCGTGTSAKLACLAADSELAPGEKWVQSSIIGSLFEASYELDAESGYVIPTIRGSAHVCSESTLIINENDPFAWGIL